MATFYTNAHTPAGAAKDPEGFEADTLELARESVVEAIRDLIASAVRTGEIDLTGTVDICDPGGRVLCTVPYSDALRVKGG
jgi:hypothetical protein